VSSILLVNRSSSEFEYLGHVAHVVTWRIFPQEIN